MRRRLEPLRVRPFGRLLASYTVNDLGDSIGVIALSILVFERTGSPLLSALVLACSFLPYALGGILLSSIADRFPARRVLVVCDLLSGLCIGPMLIPGMPVGGLLGLLLLTGPGQRVWRNCCRRICSRSGGRCCGQSVR